MLPPEELAHSSAQLYREVLLTVLRYGDNAEAHEAVAAAEEAVTDYRARFGPGPALAAQLDETEEQLRDAEDARDQALACLRQWDTLDGNSPGYNLVKARTYGRLAAFWKGEAKARGATGDEWTAEGDTEQPAERAPWPGFAEALRERGCVAVPIEEHAELTDRITELEEQLAEAYADRRLLRVYEIAFAIGMPADELRQRLQLKSVMSCLSQLREPPFVAPAERRAATVVDTYGKSTA